MADIPLTKKLGPAILLGLLPAALLTLVAYTGSFTRYIADDYCSVYWAQRFGLLRSVWHWYITWSGRFSAYASDWFVMLIGAHNVRIIPPIMLLVWLAATVVVVRSFLQTELAGWRDWLLSTGLSVMLLFTVFTLMPSVQTSYYWWNGMRSYTLPLIFLTIFAAAYPWAIARIRSTRAIALGGLVSFILMFANAGLSDTYAIVQLGLLCILALWALRDRPNHIAECVVLIAGALGTCVALLVIVLAPGNVYREASFPTHPGVIQLLSINFQGYGNLLWSIAATPHKILALVGAVFGAAWAGCIARPRPAASWRFAGAIAATGLLLAFVSMLPASWGLSEPGPDRNMSVPVFALLVSLLAAAFAVGSRLPGEASGRALPWAIALVAVLALNASALIGIQKAYETRKTYIQYAENWDVEEAQILQAKAAGAGTVTVVSWPNWAGLDVWSDHSKNWLNACAGGYYGIDIVGRAP